MGKTKAAPNLETLKTHEKTLREQIRVALEVELKDCAIPDLNQDPLSGGLWDLPTVDSKTAFKISASIVQELLGCQFKPSWIQKGGYSSIAQATDHILGQLEAHCIPTSALAAA